MDYSLGVLIDMDRNIASISHHYRFLFSALAALVLFAVIIFTGHQALAAGTDKPTSGRIITLHDHGVDKGFITKKATLREALAEQKIYIDKLDRTEPGLDEKLAANSYQVNVYRARQVIVRDGDKETKVITSYRTPKQIAAQAKIALYDEDEVKLAPSSDPIADGVAEVMTISRSTPFTFNFYGKEQTARTMARTVGDMLKEKGIKMESVDGINPAVDTPITAAMTVKLWRNGVQTITQEEDVAYDTKKIEDADQPIGYKKVTTPGENGKRTVTYEINMQNGIEVSRKEINSVATKQPVQQVEIVGAKSNYSESLQSWLAALRTCETGGNYARNSGNGYYGAYQFLPSTWNSIAKKTGRNDLVGVLPSNAVPADQDAMVIANTNMTAGLRTQHPGCYVKLGLSNKPPAQ